MTEPKLTDKELAKILSDLAKAIRGEFVSRLRVPENKVAREIAMYVKKWRPEAREK
jgi:hypothetical protein